MGRFWLACRAFWFALVSGVAASEIRLALERAKLPKGIAEAKTQPQAAAETTRSAPPAAPKRSEALTLLAALQREARFVDLVKEPLDSYSDEQIGAAARNVLRDCSAVLDRFFELQPLAGQGEGEPIEVPPATTQPAIK